MFEIAVDRPTPVTRRSARLNPNFYSLYRAIFPTVKGVLSIQKVQDLHCACPDRCHREGLVAPIQGWREECG